MPGASLFKLVKEIGRTLPDVEVTKTWGKPSLKVGGKMFVCIASHKSAEPDTLVVMMDFADRDALIEEDPRTYYLKEHYVRIRASSCGWRACIPTQFATSSWARTATSAARAGRSRPFLQPARHRRHAEADNPQVVTWRYPPTRTDRSRSRFCSFAGSTMCLRRAATAVSSNSWAHVIAVPESCAAIVTVST